MKIQSLDIFNNQSKQYKNQNFKKGLTLCEINQVKRMGTYEYENIVSRLKAKYGINADVRKSNTVAFCLESVCKIMSRAGFRLPKNFRFAPAPMSNFGVYDSSDTVTINSNHREFEDLEAQNKLAEAQGHFHPCDKHFLQTYLHEFMHAAHYKNIIDKQGQVNANQIFWKELTQKTPNEILKGPIQAFIKAEQPSLLEKFWDIIFSPEIGLYSMTDLSEYFAEKYSHELAEQLGDNFIIDNVKYNFAQSIKGFPSDWNIDDQINNMNKIKGVKIGSYLLLAVPVIGVITSHATRTQCNMLLAKLFHDDIEYLNGEIWNGNIDNLKSKSLMFKNVCY